MTIEKQLAEALEKVNTLSAQVATLTTDTAAHAAVLIERDALKVENTSLAAQVQVANTAKATAEAETVTAKAEAAQAKIDLDGKVIVLAMAKAAEMVGAAGANPIEGKAGGNASTLMKRNEFNALSAQAKMEFCKSGGKITE